MLPLQTILKNAIKFPNKIAIKDGDILLKWGDYCSMVETAIVNLRERYNMDKVDRVMVLSKNRWELVIMYSALATLKIPYTGVDYSSTLDQKNHCFNTLKPSLVIYSEEFCDDIKEFKNAYLLNIDYDFHKIIANDKVKHEGSHVLVTTNSKKFESFSFTSGTSGYPKIVYRNDSFEARRMKKFIELYDFNSDDIFLVTVPFYHVSVAGWMRLFMNLGCTVVFSDFNSPKDIYHKLIDDKITTTLIVPPVLDKLVSYMDDKDKNTSLKFLMVGGKNFPASLKQKAIRYFGNVINEYYGSTETGINVLSDSNIMNIDPYSSGLVMEGSDIMILDKNKNSLPCNKVGKIAIHSYQNAYSYLDKELNTIKILDKQYIITADYGYMDEFGKLFVVCRADTMDGEINFNIYKVENKIRLISGVNDVVISIKNNKGISNTVIYVSIKKSVSDNLKKDIDDMIRHLIKDESPVTIKFVDKIPYSLSGKVKFRELEDK